MRNDDWDEQEREMWQPRLKTPAERIAEARAVLAEAEARHKEAKAG